MPANRAPVFALAWMGLAAAYFAASALGHREATLAVLGLMAGALVAASGRLLQGLVLGAVLAAAAWRFAGSVPFLAFVPPLAAFAMLAYVFARTLRAGSEPLINRIARKEHPDLPGELARHARWLTGAWVACFAGLFLVSLGLVPVLPLEAWSRSVHALGYTVPGALFLGEYAYRVRRFPGHSQGSLAVLIPNVFAVLREMSLEDAAGARPGGERP